MSLHDRCEGATVHKLQHYVDAAMIVIEFDTLNYLITLEPGHQTAFIDDSLAISDVLRIFKDKRFGVIQSLNSEYFCLTTLAHFANNLVVRGRIIVDDLTSLRHVL